MKEGKEEEGRKEKGEEKEGEEEGRVSEYISLIL
jgi:hypothetical protein